MAELSAERSDLPPVVVLFGGPSAEHDVSIVSGTSSMANSTEVRQPPSGGVSKFLVTRPVPTMILSGPSNSITVASWPTRQRT